MPRPKKPKMVTFGGILDIIMTIELPEKYLQAFTFCNKMQVLTVTMSCRSCGAIGVNRFAFGGMKITEEAAERLRDAIVEQAFAFIDGHSSGSPEVQPEDDDDNEIVFHVSNN